MNKVYEGIANISLVLEVNGQVKKVVVALMMCVDFFKERELGIFIRDILNHHGCP